MLHTPSDNSDDGRTGRRRSAATADGQRTSRRRSTRQGGSPEGAPSPEQDERGRDGGVTDGRLPGGCTSRPEELQTRLMAKISEKQLLQYAQPRLAPPWWLDLGVRNYQRSVLRRLRGAGRHRPAAATMVLTRSASMPSPGVDAISKALATWLTLGMRNCQRCFNRRLRRARWHRPATATRRGGAPSTGTSPEGAVPADALDRHRKEPSRVVP